MSEQPPIAEKDAACTCTFYVVDHSDPEPYHPENVDREDDPACPVHGGPVDCGSNAADWCLAPDDVECTRHNENGDRRA